mmetsp:Transcript_87112/g.246978  ORF Transcript_87112/g.246978 Transcript_87112/m.246978 type:complete len:262 (-) Transcript_87112:480-1265(-)
MLRACSAVPLSRAGLDERPRPHRSMPFPPSPRGGPFGCPGPAGRTSITPASAARPPAAATQAAGLLCQRSLRTAIPVATWKHAPKTNVAGTNSVTQWRLAPRRLKKRAVSPSAPRSSSTAAGSAASLRVSGTSMLPSKELKTFSMPYTTAVMSGRMKRLTTGGSRSGSKDRSVAIRTAAAGTAHARNQITSGVNSWPASPARCVCASGAEYTIAAFPAMHRVMPAMSSLVSTSWRTNDPSNAVRATFVTPAIVHTICGANA